MHTKSKILLITTLLLLAFSLSSIVIVTINFKNFSIDSALSKAQMTAETVKDGLTAHMVNGIMDKRQYFLDKISNQKEIQSLWISRGENVIKQYGKGFSNETTRDDIDKKVLQTGKMEKEIVSSLDKTILRVTIPYKAENLGSHSCLNCHNVKDGDVLGAISMEFDITSMKNKSIISITKILITSLGFLIIIILLVNYFITPYVNLFNNITEGLKKAYAGDFTYKFHTDVIEDGKVMVDHLNTLFFKIQQTFGNIKNDLKTFMPNDVKLTNDPLGEAKVIINELADIYKFKKTIELDTTKKVVYSRLVDVLETKYEIKHLALYEVNNITNKRELIYISQNKSICFDEVDNNAELCRAYRTKSDIISTDFKDLCKACNAKDINYLCIPFTINKNHSIILSITAKSLEEFNKINAKIANIKNYLESAKPVIENKILMDALRDTSLRDGMTGLYNRRFLDEVIDKIMHQAKRNNTTYTIMMLDVDFFKKVNDTYGHDVGDKVIVAIGKILKESIRESDLAIRYGGEEFVVMLENATDEGAMEVAKKIHTTFAQTVFEVGDGKTMQKTMSIGIAKYPRDSESIWQCIKLADTALYVAKTTGRNKIVIYEKKMSQDEHLR
ncbi:diguanylate cyclase/phosphodiesterase (GGDEF & EAL domains) with PAS/PAC sensor(s) [hydrothermal vent metagenome]|uniref:Diguanylate cyclase/phosphodiesterase (GGDEF & EAL domains) with PAS/PAC sensor(S) n=1 Tax=hydrothermal vent metagenome TaxID=652676 RepID=A0A1W1D350_9ZZZZ